MPKRRGWAVLSITLGILCLVGVVWFFLSPCHAGWLVITLPLSLLGAGIGHLSRFKSGYRTGCVVAILALIVFVLRPTYQCSEGVVAPQAAAIGSLRTLNTAELTYAETYPHGFSPSLNSLRADPHAKNPTESAAGLIDDLLASGEKLHYRFVYSPGARDEKGRINSYTILANPTQAGEAYYFTDQTGVIRQNSSRPASATDPPIAG
ncbi:MAG: hypothetical protein ABSF45_30100 [Terriglobia bacterium]|jgi:hypothetical protein